MRNWRIAGLATAALLSTVLLIMACISLVGWKVEVVISLCLTIAGGLAVDYVVHIAHAYTHAAAATAVGRARTALREMGISVLSGGLTTLAATLPLHFCVISFFYKFGAFMWMLVGASFSVATVGFIALLARFGPENGSGRIAIPGVCGEAPDALPAAGAAEEAPDAPEVPLEEAAPAGAAGATDDAQN